MSFSQDVKNELENVLPNARHCQLAELSAINTFYRKRLDKRTVVGRKFFTLQKKTSMIDTYVDTGFKNSCCKRAYLRGAFLSIGSIADPNKGYDLEFVCEDEVGALSLKGYINSFGIDAHITLRKNSYVLYVKEAESLVDTLNVLGAHNALMYIESLRAEKDFRNLINRKVNCETANLNKTVYASDKQINDIRKIEMYLGLDKLPTQLSEMARVRMEHPDSSLTELGEYLDPPVGKSGVNHRLRKLSKIAEDIQV